MTSHALDLRFVNNTSGIGRDSKFFHSALKKLIPEIFEFGTPLSAGKKFRVPGKVWIKSQVGWSEKIDTSSIDFLFQSHIWNLEPSKSTRRVIRIHDIFPLTNPKWFRQTSVKSYKQSFSLIRTDDLLLADSKFTAEQIMMYKDNLKVEVLHCKIPSPEDFECLDCVKCRIYQLPEIFVLCVNTIEPRKNYGNLLKAWERSSHADSTAKLLIIGRRGWKCGELIQKIRATRNVVWIDDACDGLVGKAYQGAQFVINPSYAEGFNFPTLEAKVFERPCYASDIPVNQELHCDIAKFNPYDVDEITTTINRGFLDSKLNYNPITANTDKFYNDLRNILIENRII